MKTIGVSKMGGKLAGIAGINTNPLTNSFCNRNCIGTICAKCYSKRMLTTFRMGCVKPFERNGKALSQEALQPYEIPRITKLICRFNAHGELINQIHFDNLVRIAAFNPEVTCSLWTKRPELVRFTEEFPRPKNLILIYSGFKLNETVDIPEGFDGSFSVYDTELPPEQGNVFHCLTSCLECRLCYNLNHKGFKIVERISLVNGKRKTK